MTPERIAHLLEDCDTSDRVGASTVRLDPAELRLLLAAWERTPAPGVHPIQKDIAGPYGACHARSGYGYLEGDRWCVSYKTCEKNWLPRTVSRDDANEVIGIMGKAYEAGYAEAKRQIRVALGTEQETDER